MARSATFMAVCPSPPPASSTRNVWPQLASSGVQILPEDRLTQLPFGGAVNIARKLFSNVIEIAIPHGRVPLANTKPLFCHTRAENEAIWCKITVITCYMVKKGTKRMLFTLKIHWRDDAPSAAAHLIALGLALVWFSRFQKPAKR
jgi:hypothetical protein